MTVQVQTPGVAYVGNGVSTVFAYPFRVLDGADLTVKVNNVTLVYNTDYTVDGVNNNNGGNVTFVVPPPNLESIDIRRIMELIQPTDYRPYDPFPAETHERALDRLTMLLQNMLFNAERSLLMESGPSLKTSQLPIAAPIQVTDYMAIVQNGLNKQAPVLAVLAKQLVSVFALEDAGSQETAITAGADKMIWDGFPACTLLAIWGGLRAASSSGDAQVDLNLNGVSLMAVDKCVFKQGQLQTGLGGANPPALTTTVIPHKSRISMDYDAAGTGVKGVIIYVACLVNPDYYPIP